MPADHVNPLTGFCSVFRTLDEHVAELMEGSDWGGLYANKRKYLRRLPKDPFDEYDEGWGMRSYKDDPDTTFSSGEDIYDVFSQSTRYGLDGTPYNIW